ncbi:hypothetical protein D3C79_781470 [compost metagenome]
MAALVVRLGEAGLAGFEHHPVKAVVGDADAAEGLRQHARLAPGDHRVGEEQVAGLEHGVKRLELERSTGGGERIMGLARFAITLGVDRQNARARGTAAAVEFQPEHGVGIEAEPDRARGVARFELAEKTLTPFAVVTHTRQQLVAVQVVVACVHVETRPFDKTFGLFLVGLGSEGHRCSQCNEQRGEA